jgi:hypothetical protein
MYEVIAEEYPCKIPVTLQYYYQNSIFKPYKCYQKMSFDPIANYKQQIETLTTELKASYLTLKDVINHSKMLEQRIILLTDRLSRFEKREDGYNPQWSWIDKIVFILKDEGRPMQSFEIVEKLDEREPDIIERMYEPEKYFSVVLAKAKEYGRVTTIKQKGTRGALYMPTDLSQTSNPS